MVGLEAKTGVRVGRIVNAGRRLHRPDLLPLPGGVPPIEQQVRGRRRIAVVPFAGIPPRRPGEIGTFAVDLVAGRRDAIVCFARDEDDDDSHALLGMVTEFRPGD